MKYVLAALAFGLISHNPIAYAYTPEQQENIVHTAIVTCVAENLITMWDAASSNPVRVGAWLDTALPVNDSRIMPNLHQAIAWNDLLRNCATPRIAAQGFRTATFTFKELEEITGEATGYRSPHYSLDYLISDYSSRAFCSDPSAARSIETPYPGACHLKSIEQELTEISELCRAKPTNGSCID